MQEAFASQQPKVKSQAQIVKKTTTASYYHSSCSDEWYTYHVVIIKFEGVSSQHQFTGCSGSAGEVQEPERREQDKSSITTLDFLRTDLTSQEQTVVHQSSLKNPQDTVLWREKSAEELSNAGSSSTHNLQHSIWNTTTYSGCSRTRNTCLPEGVWERPLRCLKNWRFCCMRSNQASRDCLAVKRENLGGWGRNSLHVNTSTSIWWERAKMMETYSSRQYPLTGQETMEGKKINTGSSNYT